MDIFWGVVALLLVVGPTVAALAVRREDPARPWFPAGSDGAGPDGADYGGFRRDTWTYDDATKLWTWTNNHVSPPTAEVSLDGPAGERFHGCYRPKVGT